MCASHKAPILVFAFSLSLYLPVGGRTTSITVNQASQTQMPAMDRKT